MSWLKSKAKTNPPTASLLPNVFPTRMTQRSSLVSRYCGVERFDEITPTDGQTFPNPVREELPTIQTLSHSVKSNAVWHLQRLRLLRDPEDCEPPQLFRSTGTGVIRRTIGAALGMPTEFHRRDSSPPVFQYVCLAILFARAMLFQSRYAQDIWRTEKVDAPFFMPASASASLEIVRPEAQKLGVHTGDTLLAVNGQNYTGTALLSEAYATARLGDQFELRVKSASGEHSVVLP